VVRECDWAHHASIGGVGSAGDDPGKLQQRGHGGMPTAAGEARGGEAQCAAMGARG
jgi:hypothetical protein